MDNKDYGKEYSESSLFTKLKSVFARAGVSVVYGVLLLFFALKDPRVPKKAKITIIGALGYFIAPIDFIMDAIPVVGYGDDMTAILAALGIISVYITPEIKRKARDQATKWFPTVGNSDFESVEKQIELPPIDK